MGALSSHVSYIICNKLMMKNFFKRTLILLTMFVVGLSESAKAQEIGIKSNLLSDAFLNINLGAEVGLAPKWTMDVSGQFNA